MLVKLDIDVPEGFEVVGCYPPKEGEYYLDADTLYKAIKAQSNFNNARIVLRKKHVWPKWVKPGWISVDKDGTVNWSLYKPTLKRDNWTYDVMYDNLELFLDLPLPHFNDWTEACWKVTHD